METMMTPIRTIEGWKPSDQERAEKPTDFLHDNGIVRNQGVVREAEGERGEQDNVVEDGSKHGIESATTQISS